MEDERMKVEDEGTKVEDEETKSDDDDRKKGTNGVDGERAENPRIFHGGNKGCAFECEGENGVWIGGGKGEKGIEVVDSDTHVNSSPQFGGSSDILSGDANIKVFDGIDPKEVTNENTVTLSTSPPAFLSPLSSLRTTSTNLSCAHIDPPILTVMTQPPISSSYGDPSFISTSCVQSPPSSSLFSAAVSGTPILPSSSVVVHSSYSPFSHGPTSALPPLAPKQLLNVSSKLSSSGSSKPHPSLTSSKVENSSCAGDEEQQDKKKLKITDYVFTPKTKTNSLNDVVVVPKGVTELHSEAVARPIGFGGITMTAVVNNPGKDNESLVFLFVCLNKFLFLFDYFSS
jgi:hypothetical protein